MTDWIRACAVEDCPSGSAIEVVVADSVVALFNVGGTFYALDGVCPHQGGPLGQGQLGGGQLEDCIVTCPWHGWQFDVRDGQNQLSHANVHPTFDVRVEGNEVLIQNPAATERS